MKQKWNAMTKSQLQLKKSLSPSPSLLYLPYNPIVVKKEEKKQLITTLEGHTLAQVNGKANNGNSIKNTSFWASVRKSVEMYNASSSSLNFELWVLMKPSQVSREIDNLC